MTPFIGHLDYDCTPYFNMYLANYSKFLESALTMGAPSQSIGGVQL